MRVLQGTTDTRFYKFRLYSKALGNCRSELTWIIHRSSNSSVVSNLFLLIKMTSRTIFAALCYF